MKKLTLLIVLAGLMTAGIAQKIGFKLNGGLVRTQQPADENRVRFDRYTEKNLISFSPTFYGKIDVVQNLEFRPALGYNYFKSWNYNIMTSTGTIDEYYKYGNHSINIDLPLQLNIRVTTESEGYPYLIAGIVGQYYLKETVNKSNLDYYKFDDFRDFTLHYGFMVCFGVNITKNLFTELEYRKTTTDKVDSDFEYLGLTLGYNFFEFKK